MLGDDELLCEARVALEDVRGALPTLENFSLCHGQAGCADVLIEASRVLGDSSWLAPAEQAARFGIERFERAGRPWPGGMNRMLETPDLMWGTAGIALFYLRMADPGLTPTILLSGAC
jgi:lantibiotic modifying enzyme